MTALAPLRTQANEAWQRVRNQDRGQGVGQLVDKCTLLVARADRHYQGDEAAEATAAWKEQIALCKVIDDLCVQRQSAITARKDAEQTRKSVGNPTQKGPGFAAYARDSKAAVVAFDAGKFADAAGLWNAAKGHMRDEER